MSRLHGRRWVVLGMLAAVGAIAPPARAESGGGVELTGLRTQTSRTYRRHDGTRSVRISAASMNFRDAAGTWRAIDTALKLRGDAYVSGPNRFSFSAPRRLGASPFAVGVAGGRVTFSPRETGRVTADVAGGRVAYASAWPGIKLRYTVTADAIAEALVVADRASVRDVAFDLRLSAGLQPRLERSGGVSIVGTDQRALLQISPSIMVDAAGAGHKVTSALRREGASWVLSIRPDRAWLNAPARRWPVVIDPQVSAPTTAACSISSQGDMDSCTSVLPVSGQSGSPNADYHSLLKFDVSSVPAGAFVNEARLFATYADDPFGLGTGVTAHRVLSSWNSSATWTSRNGTDDWTTAGGDIDPVALRGQLGPPHFEWDASDIAQGWVDGTLPNYGVLIEGLMNPLGPLYVEGPGNSSPPELWVDYTVTSLRLTLSDELRTDPIVAGRNSYPLSIHAADPNASVANVRVKIDIDEQDRFEPDPGCTSPCAVSIPDYIFDTDWAPEGQHWITVEATNEDGDTVYRTWLIDVPRKLYYGQALYDWGVGIGQTVDALDPAPLTEPFPQPPEDYWWASHCDTEAELAACFDAVRDWGDEVEQWLRDNLTDDTDAAGLPSPPVFDYGLELGTDYDLTNQMSSSFAIARHRVAAPDEPLDVAIGFHEPLTPAQVEAALPANATLYDDTEIRGYFDSSGRVWQGADGPDDVNSVSDSLDDFYADQRAIVDDQLANLDDQPDDDTDEQSEIASSVASLEALGEVLDNRDAYISGITVRLEPESEYAARAALAADPAIKTVMPIGAEAADPMLSGSAALGTMAPDTADLDTPSGSARRADANGDTCDDRNEDELASHSLLQINPAYYAPSRFNADANVSTQGGSGPHQKWFWMRFRWWAPHSLTWFCMGGMGKKTVELEAKVYPSHPRWSTNWGDEIHRGRLTDMPGKWYYDDLAQGGLRPDALSPDEYPDFAIITNQARKLQYGRLYHVWFTTNKGETNNGTVIWSVQANSTPYKKVYSAYCNGRKVLAGGPFGDAFPSCRFATVTTCYGTSQISGIPFYLKVDWRQQLGTDKIRLSDVPSQYRDPDNPSEVTKLCDPRPES